jgi:hypothetical protein
MRDNHIVCANGDSRVEHHNQGQPDQRSDDLGRNETRSRARGDAGEAVGENPAHRKAGLANDVVLVTR